MGKAIKLQNKKTGENLYPMSASDLVFDPVTKKTVKADLAEKIGDAPSDGKQYARKDGAWGEVNIPESGIGEAPKDGMQYVRKDGEWEKISPDEICQITLKSNQGDSDASSLIGASVKVIATEDSSELFNGTWNGETIIVPIQQGTEYKIVVGALDGYATPDEQTYTASAFVNRDVEVMYNTELVRVALSADDSSSVSGQIVTINGVAHTYGSTAVEQKVPFGTEYTVSVNDKSGYITPASQTFTASESVRNLEVVYKLDLTGVWIQDVNGKLWAVDDWDDSVAYNGIAIITENHSFVMAPKYITGTQYPFGGTSDVEGVTTTTDITVAQNDFNGYENTQILAANSSKSANLAKDYIFPNGKNGYLPSAGEAQIVLDNLSEVMRAATITAEYNVKTIKFVTSTQYTGGEVWHLMWTQDENDSNIYYHSLGHYPKTSTKMVWAVTTIE